MFKGLCKRVPCTKSLTKRELQSHCWIILCRTSRVSTASKVQIAFASSNGGVFFECRVQCVDASAPTATTTAPFRCDQSGVFAPCVSPRVVTLDEGLLAQGRRQYVFSVRAVDSANNRGTCNTPVDVLTSPAFHECSSYSWCVACRMMFGNGHLLKGTVYYVN